jgi:hypothetical protein
MSDFVRRENIRDMLHTILPLRVLGFKESPEYRGLRGYELGIPGVVSSTFGKYLQRLHEEEMKGNRSETMEKAICSAHDMLNSLAASHETDILVEEEVFESFDCPKELLDAMRQRMGPAARDLFDKYIQK